MASLRFPQTQTSKLLLRLPWLAQVVIVTLSAILIHSTLGTIYTFGNMNPYLTSYLRAHGDPSATPTKLNWIFVLQAGCQCLSMSLGGFIEKKLGPSYTAILGGLIMRDFSSGVFVTKWSLNVAFPFLIVTYGLFFGVGLGFAYNACLICLMKWLPKNRGLANGLVLIGFGIGAFIFNPIQTKFINPNNLSPNCDPDHNGKFKYFCQKDLLDRVPSVFYILGGTYFLLQLIGFLFLVDPPKIDEMEELVSEEEEEPFVESKEALRSSTLYLLWFTFFSNSVTIFFISTLYKTFGQTFIRDDLFLSLTGSLASVFNAVGRVVWGLLGDKYSFQVAMTVLSSCLTIFMMTLFWSSHIPSPYLAKAVFLFWVCAIFFSFSGNFSLFPLAASRCFGPKYVGINYGFVISSVAGGAVFSAVLAQTLLHRIGYSNMFFLCSAFAYVGFILTALIQFTKHGKGVQQSIPVDESIESTPNDPSDLIENI